MLKIFFSYWSSFLRFLYLKTNKGLNVRPKMCRVFKITLRLKKKKIILFPLGRMIHLGKSLRKVHPWWTIERLWWISNCPQARRNLNTFFPGEFIFVSSQLIRSPKWKTIVNIFLFMLVFKGVSFFQDLIGLWERTQQTGTKFVVLVNLLQQGKNCFIFYSNFEKR